MRQTRKYLRGKIRECRRLYRIVRSVYRHRKTYLKGIGHIGKSVKSYWKL
ncbi:MAG: hypothetical protein HFH60_08015 [Lachnospiraceae bacterium]|nr:hypothetical protein [Lachnospiraceae bacterium]